MPKTVQRLITTGSITFPAESGGSMRHQETGLRDEAGQPLTPHLVEIQGPVAVIQKNANGSFDAFCYNEQGGSYTWKAQYTPLVDAPPVAVAEPATPSTVPKPAWTTAGCVTPLQLLNEAMGRVQGDLKKCLHTRTSPVTGTPIPALAPGLLMPYQTVEAQIENYPTPGPNVTFDPVNLGRFTLNLAGLYRIKATALVSLAPLAPANSLLLQLIQDPAGTPAPILSATSEKTTTASAAPESVTLEAETELQFPAGTVIEAQILGTGPGAVLGALTVPAYSGTLIVERVDQGQIIP